MLIPRKTFWFLGIIIVLLIIFFPAYSKIQELRDRNRDLDARIKKVELENRRLKQEISRIQDDPIYQEEVVREKFGVVRKGEVVYKIGEE